MTLLPPTDCPSDEQLLDAIATGDQQAFVTLFRRRRHEIYRFAMHMTASAATAEDVTQEVFIVVMRDASRFDARRATAMAWLCGIARNHVRRRLEQERALQPLDDAEDEIETPMATNVDPLSALATAERIAALRRAVMSLPMRYREAVLLCDLQELSYAEAATALGCAIGTVRSRLHRGRALLAAKLRETQDDARRVTFRRTGCFA